MNTQQALDITTHMSFTAIMGKNIFAADELVQKCKDASHALSEDADKLARAFSFVKDDGTIHEETRESILRVARLVGL